MEDQQGRVATMVDWMFAPEWLTVSEACRLSGHDRGTMLHIVDVGGVDTNDQGLIDRWTLYEFQETLVEVLHWYD